jgi:hypothetical protein
MQYLANKSKYFVIAMLSVILMAIAINCEAF